MSIQTALRDNQATIIDVRESYEFEVDHIHGALNIPLGEVPRRFTEFRNMTKPLVLYCRSGNRSGQAANYLLANGIKEVYNGGGLYDMKHYLLNAR